jgi:hypothetical protein
LADEGKELEIETVDVADVLTGEDPIVSDVNELNRFRT